MALAYPIIETLLERHIRERAGKLSEMPLTPEQQAELKEIFLARPASQYPQCRYVPTYNIWICVDENKYFLATVKEVQG